MSQITVTVQKKTRSTQKPKVEISRYKAKQFIKESGIKIEAGQCYVIYNCGHVFDNRNDSQIVSYYSGENRGIRSCPICHNEKLLTKFKRCGCGAEHTGKRVQPSKCCARCSTLRKATGREVALNEYKRNKHLADPSRCFCIHRDECLIKYFVYDAVPCKGCTKYQVDTNSHEAVMTRH